MRDVGLYALDVIKTRLGIEDAWSVRGERGFGWIASNLIQHIHASPMFESLDVMVSQIVIETRVVDSVTNDARRIHDVLCNKNAFAVSSGLVYDEPENVVSLVAAHTVHEESLEYRGTQLASFAILQLLEAEGTSSGLAQICKGEIPFGDHPVNGIRTTPHEWLDRASREFREAGNLPSLFVGLAEYQAVADFIRNTPFATMGATAEGISIEVPFGEHDTAIIRMTSDVRHPAFGNGLAIRAVFRLNDPGQDAVALACYCQRQHLRTVSVGGQLGGWGVAPDVLFDHFAWSRFIPNAMFQKGVILDAAIGEINRCGWVDGLLYPGLSPRNAWEIMLARERMRESARSHGPPM